MGAVHSAPGLHTEALVQWRRIIVWQNTDKKVMRRRTFAAEVTKRAAGELVAPDVCAQKRPRQGTAYTAGVAPHDIVS